ncbi:hypothetical protein ACFQAT_08720 [Undibacterium arcticum]|uniref:Uncharacterized protein n=1 Tax=Undibacterium arcticum TaxID=1762892 RepID=A0ABV7F9Y7_9BURK
MKLWRGTCHEFTQPQVRERNVAMLQQSPAVAMAHGDLRRVLDALGGYVTR